MSVGSVISSGVQGIHASSRSMQASAQTIASAANSTSLDTDVSKRTSLVEPLANLKQQQNLFDASAKVVETGNDMIGSLLDIKA